MCSQTRFLCGDFTGTRCLHFCLGEVDSGGSETTTCIRRFSQQSFSCGTALLPFEDEVPHLCHVRVVAAAEELTSALCVVKSSCPAARDLEGVLMALRLRFAAPCEALSSVVDTQRS